jgi:enediyne biosynthesis protein E4
MRALVVAVLIGVTACGPSSPTPSPAAPGPGAPQAAPPGAPAAPANSSPLPTFVDVATEAGITAANHSGKPAQKDWIVSGMGGGTIVLDYDGDGRMDLLIVDGTMLTEKGELQYDDEWRTRLYRNEGGMRFTDVTRQAGIDVKAFGFGGASCDYDGDGRPDVYVCTWGRNHLLRNRGDGTFEDVTDRAGVAGADDDMSTACCWGDVDGDGIPDLYVANYIDQWKFIKQCREKGLPGRNAEFRGNKVYVGPPGLTGQQDRLYLGSPDGTFREVTKERLPPEDPLRYGFQPVMSDFDNDGDLDIYVANDTQPNYLYVNDGKGKFTDFAVEAGAAVDFDSRAQASMGVDVADVNRDGWLDIVVTNFSHDHNTIYVNQTGRANRLSFRDMSNAYNLTRPSYLRLSWGTRLLDYDNDGELDLFIACGHVYGEIDTFEATTGSTYKQRNLLMHNDGPPRFTLTDKTDVGGPAFGIKRVWRGAAFGDFDDDGDMDVFVTALNDVPALLRNDGGNRNGFIAFRLVGAGRMRDPCGARVTVELDDGRTRVEELHHGASFCGDNDPRLFFGLGSGKRAKRVSVRWPDGTTQSFDDVAGRRFWLVEQGKPDLKSERE